MSSDELIDNVARQMTAVEGRSGMRVRVLAGLGEAQAHTPRRWLLPAGAGAAVAVIALAWVMTPSSPVIQDAPVVAQQAPVTAPAPAVAAPPTVEVARSTPTRLPVRRDQSAPAAAVTTWAEVPMVDVPTLPPLAGPPPIVIEPIAWREVTIAPLEVALIEVKAIEIEPLSSADHSGV